MQRTTLQTSHTFALLVAGMLASCPALADKPLWADGGKSEKHEKKEKHQDETKRERYQDNRADHAGSRDGVSVEVHFGDRHRVIAHDYFAKQFRAGKCPPGLAKKHNGCLPPGQAKKWMMGRPLPRDVVYYELPPAVVVRLGPPPTGHRYVRVATDILLITVGTSMVVDAIQDLGNM